MAMYTNMLLFIFAWHPIASSISQKYRERFYTNQNASVSASNAAEILAKPLTECAVTCTVSGGRYIAKKTEGEECTCVGEGETLPHGTWTLFIHGKFVIL